jgi:histidyl-tRNA synthetase
MSKKAETITAPRGTKDILPEEAAKWSELEQKWFNQCALFGFSEIRVPTFESTDLYCRGVGESTDIVGKEMFTFEDRGGRSLTLRPEGTAGVVRSTIENGLLWKTMPLQLCYNLSCFRNERPQAGRFKEFHQFGAEVFGVPFPTADAEIIKLAHGFFQSLGIDDLELHINSIGCPTCREEYKNALLSYLETEKNDLCRNCQERLATNPLRIIDCKEKLCQDVTKNAPSMQDYLCESCAEHFSVLQYILDESGIAYRVNPKIVRGLDYYNRTVFEFISSHLGAQSTVCGGGRYDSLVETLGGKPTPALGFGMGVERLMLILDAVGYKYENAENLSVYVCAMSTEAMTVGMKLVEGMRRKGIPAGSNLMDKSLKSQMKFADKIGADYAIVIGTDELRSHKAEIKPMRGQTEIPQDIAEFCLPETETNDNGETVRYVGIKEYQSK